MQRKHSVSIKGHPTSFSLEDEFYRELKAIAAQKQIPLAALITNIDKSRPVGRNLSSAIRVFVLTSLLEYIGH